MKYSGDAIIFAAHCFVKTVFYMLSADVNISFPLANLSDFDYIYGLCEATMRGYVEADLGDCFEAVAQPIITALLTKGLFSTIEVNGTRVGAIAMEQHETHNQLEELYVEPTQQNSGVGKAVMANVIAQARLRGKPIRLHVLASNRANEFYARQGFLVTKETKQVRYMELIPC